MKVQWMMGEILLIATSTPVSVGLQYLFTGLVASTSLCKLWGAHIGIAYHCMQKTRIGLLLFHYVICIMI